MKRLVALALVFPATAQAHSGEHADVGFLHLIGAADHPAVMAVMVASAACTAFLFWLRG